MASCCPNDVPSTRQQELARGDSNKVGQYNNDEGDALNAGYQLLDTNTPDTLQKSTVPTVTINNVGHVGPSQPSTRNSGVDQRERGSNLHSLDPDGSCSSTHVPQYKPNLPVRHESEQDKFPDRSTSPGLDYHPLAPHWEQVSAPTCPPGNHPDLSSIPNATETPPSPRRQRRPSVKIETARIAPVASTNNTQWSSSSANGPSVKDSPSNEKVDEDSEWDGFRSQCVEMLRTLLSTALCFMSPLFLLGEMNGGAWAWV